MAKRVSDLVLWSDWGRLSKEGLLLVLECLSWKSSVANRLKELDNIVINEP